MYVKIIISDRNVKVNTIQIVFNQVESLLK